MSGSNIQNMQKISNESSEAKRIPIHGSMTRPADPKQGFEEMKNGRLEWKGGTLTIEIETEEFTSSCPTTGQPDFNKIYIEYVPDKYYLESKTIKYYIWSYREHGAHCETLADSICRHICEAVEPKSVTVTVDQNPRGGVRIVSTAEWSKPIGLAVSLTGLPAERSARQLEKALGGKIGKAEGFINGPVRP